MGALLSALTFHNNSDKCFHQIGQGKPYGFGKIKVEAKLIGSSENEQIKLMAKFEKKMDETVKKWNESDQIKELFTLSNNEVDNDKIFEYMLLKNKDKKNEFLEVKNSNKYLKSYIELLSNNKEKIFSPKSLLKYLE